MFCTGQEIGLYTLVKRIGRGGFGEVWLAERRTKFVTTKVAVKLPLEEQVDVETIKLEAVLWEQASGHPNVLPLIEADEYDGQIIIVTEYASEGSLEQLLEKTGSLPAKRAVELAIGILNGLEFLHSRKIIHRDVKPGNILIQGAIPRLTDFGISRVLKSTSTSMSSSGTPAYMAPEAFDRKRTVQTDIWSAGAVLYQMLSGKLPFPHDDLPSLFAAILRDEPEELPAFVPMQLQDIVSKSLAKNAADRFQSASQMAYKLSDFLVFASQENFDTTIAYRTRSKIELFEEPVISNSLYEQETEKDSVLALVSDGLMRPPRVLAPTGRGRSRILLSGMPAVILLILAGAYLFFGTAKTFSSVYVGDATLIPFRNGDRFGFIDRHGKPIIEPKYDYVRPVSGGIAIVNTGWKEEFNEGKLTFFRQGKWGMIDEVGNEIIPPKYDDISELADGVAVFNIGLEFDKKRRTLAAGKYGLIDKTGHVIVPPKYDHIGEFHEGLAQVEINNKNGFIDRGGEIVISPSYGRVGDFQGRLAMVDSSSFFRGIVDGAIATSKGRAGKSGFIDMSGKEIIPLKFDSADDFSEGLASVTVDDRCGFIDRSCSLVIPAKYSSCGRFSEGLAPVCLDSKWGFIDKNGNLMIPMSYDFAEAFSEGLALVNIGWSTTAGKFTEPTGKWGFVDKDGMVVIPLKYDHAEKFREGRAL
jgi:serine/threonine protein kinase